MKTFSIERKINVPHDKAWELLAISPNPQESRLK